MRVAFAPPLLLAHPRARARPRVCVRASASADEPPPALEARPSRPDAPTDAPGAPDAQRAAAQLRSGVVSSMRDYFGDDGREVAEFCARPRAADGSPMYRTLIVGSGARELALARRLAECAAVCGLYYVPDDAGACALDFSGIATSTAVADVARFARWARVDAVFVGPDRAGAVPPDVEKALAEAAVTVFPHDVAAAVADGTLDPAACLAPLVGDEDDASYAVAGDKPL